MLKPIWRWLLRHGAPEGVVRSDVVGRIKHFMKAFLIEPVMARLGGWARLVNPPLAVDRPEVLNDLLQRHGAAPLTWSSTAAEVSDLGAVRLALGLLQERPDLRRQFPRALSEGESGAYCRWLCSAAVTEFGLGGTASDNIRAAFARRLDSRVCQIYDHDSHLRSRIPLALTPAGTRQLLSWLLLCGKAKHDLLDEEIWWFLLAQLEDPCRGIAATYLRTPLWQKRFPIGLTVFGRERLRSWIASHYGIRDAWLDEADLSGLMSPLDELRHLYAATPRLRALAPQAFVERGDTLALLNWLRGPGKALAPPSHLWWGRLEAAVAQGLAERPGVNVLGHFCYPSGLGEAGHFLTHALDCAGIGRSCRDVPTSVENDRGDRADYLGLEPFDGTIIAVPPEPNLDACFPQSGLWAAPGKHRIGVWYCEQETAPPRWARHARLLQEVWAPTRFIAEALRPVMPIPVIDMLPGVELGTVSPLTRGHFGLPEDRFLFLFMFDMWSVMERKNPLGLIRAFRQAFPIQEPVSLVIKVARGHLEPDNLAILQRAAAEAGARVIDSVMSRQEAYALMNACDAYVSLHRSEGFGLTMAEAMLMGKPVIATGYSGNLDFMAPGNSLLVDFKRVTNPHGLANYPRGAVWAEPSAPHAAAQLRWVYEHPKESRALGARARAETSRLLSLEAAGRRMARRLEAIRAARQARPLAA
jgi:glycosyltransferase involved in cell wall biosynthesis